MVIVAGKGGVGKTTVTAVLARMASRVGVSSLIVEVDARGDLARAFGRPALGYEESVLVERGRSEAGIGARELSPDRALLEYLDDHGLRRISKRLVSTGAVDVVATAAPGMKDILVLGKVKQLERAQAADLLILDAPAAGHAITFLTSAHGLLDAIRVGPIRSQAQEVVDLLTDPARCRVLLVTLPEETPINEVSETAILLRDRVGVDLGPVVVNCVYPTIVGLEVDPGVAAAEAGLVVADREIEALRNAADFRLRRQHLQAAQCERLSKMLPLPRLRLPFVFDGDLGPRQILRLADALAAEIEAM